MQALLDVARSRLAISESTLLGSVAVTSATLFVCLLLDGRVHPLVVYLLQCYLAF